MNCRAFREQESQPWLIWLQLIWHRVGKHLFWWCKYKRIILEMAAWTGRNRITGYISFLWARYLTILRTQNLLQRVKKYQCCENGGCPWFYHENGWWLWYVDWYGWKGLSGGERQRISLRTILKNPKILDLRRSDVRCGHPDGIGTSRKRLNCFLEEERHSISRTACLLSGNADRLVVIEMENLVEMGTHAEIYALEGVYYRLYQIQKDALKMRGLEEG